MTVLKGRTHLSAGLLIGTAMTSVAPIAALLPIGAPMTNVPNALAVIGAAGLGALLPDLDCCTSKLGRKVAPASLAIQLFIGHRTLFHAPLLYAVLGFFAIKFFPVYTMLWYAALFGVASHLLLDTFNAAGVPWLYPLKWKLHLAKFRSGGIIDNILGILLAAAFFIVLFKAPWFPKLYGGKFV